MSAKNFNFGLSEYNIVKPKASSALPWQILTAILALAVAGQFAYYNFYKKASATTQSAAPDSMAWRARNSAVEPVEQLLLTLTIGIPVMPTG